MLVCLLALIRAKSRRVASTVHRMAGGRTLCILVLLDWSLTCPALSPQMEQKRVSTTLLVLDLLLIQL